MNSDFRTLKKKTIQKKIFKIFIPKFGGMKSFFLLCSAKQRKNPSFAPKIL